MGRRSRAKRFPSWEPRHRQLADDATILTLFRVPRSWWPPAVIERNRKRRVVRHGGMRSWVGDVKPSERANRIVSAWIKRPEATHGR